MPPKPPSCKRGGAGAEKDMQKALLKIKKRYGKNAVIKGMDLIDGATAKERNDQIGGHKA